MGKKLVDPDKLCMGCMHSIDRTDRPCPVCGFLKSSYVQPENSMPLYEIIKGKYLIGRVIGIGGFGITYIGWDFYQSNGVFLQGGARLQTGMYVACARGTILFLASNRQVIRLH